MINITIPLGKPTDVQNSPGVDDLTKEIAHLSGLDTTEARNFIWGISDPANKQSDTGTPGVDDIPGPTTVKGSLDALKDWLAEQATTLIFALVVLLLIIFGIHSTLKGK